MRKILLVLVAIAGVIAIASPIKSMLGADGAEITTEDWTPTAADYILDGLVFFWDSIENVGFGERDPDATVWTDLINGVELSLCQQASFTDDGLVISATDDNISTAYITRPYSTTAAIAEEAMGSGRTPYSCTCSMNVVVSDPVKTGSVVTFDINGGGGRLMLLSDGMLQYKYGGAPQSYSLGNLAGKSLRLVETFSLEIGENNEEIYSIQIYLNGEVKITFSTIITSNHYTYGRVLARPLYREYANYNGFINAEQYKPFEKGGTCKNLKIRDIMVYNRALTPDEIRYNYLIDRLRFNLP